MASRKWLYLKDELDKMINVESISYEEIGRRYGCSGANIKKQARKLGIEIPKRREISEKETFGRGRGKIRTCLSCGSILTEPSQTKFCDNKCQQDYRYKEYNGACQICGWKEKNEFTGKVPLQIHHIDGNCCNNKEDNLQLLCPNHHSLTETYGNGGKHISHRVNRKGARKIQPL